MSTQTPNINLVKPIASENYDLNVVNANADILDAEIMARATLASPVLSDNPQTPTFPNAENSTIIASTAFVKNQAYAPLASPALTGNPTSPTFATSENSTVIATTAFVKNQAYAPLASPSLTGVPTIEGQAVPTVSSTTVKLIRAGSAVVLTNGAGAATISFDAFPNATGTFIASNGSSAIRPDMNVSATEPYAANGVNIFVADSAGAGIASTTMRINYIALGY